MLPTRFAALAATTTVLFAGSAAAQGLFSFDPAEPGVYVAGFVGSGTQNDAEFSGIQNPATGSPGMAGVPANVAAEYDSDAFYGGAVGYRLPFKYWTYFQPRLELEVSTITDASVADGSFNGGQQSFGGDQSVLFALLNNYSDIRWSDTQTVVPYFGGGIGIGEVDANVLYAGGGAPAPTFGVIGEDSGLAGTIAAGLTLETSDHFNLYAEARYYQIRDIELDRRFIADGADVFNASVSDDLDGFTVSVGARVNF